MSTKIPKSKESLQSLDKESERLGIGGFSNNHSDEDKYKRRMQQRKEVQSKRVSERGIEKGLKIVFTGQGKGKTQLRLEWRLGP